ncbi:efflux RND transporter periplasmic adaptor subunit [Sphingomonas nostoxanthinifaciens]|uniref:efflux RND transporter periplasmic adaptor subunit n=1 Tax=Sphingomonas nostoxanthinifaciens TaxID=2872652 RepID=UPI001CC1FB91|nr:efflux RND transporter periplasmic adaptor subunit [Sphingomonas nostoxanthinifaciens]UAK26408.1 efflux RND transporter periplasmic adaptor subunit [Sphingomonas nostoxanthinifaciens]
MTPLARSGRICRVAAVLVPAAIALAACTKKTPPAPPPPEAGYVVVKAETVALMVSLPGRTSAFETSDVRPQVSGLIKARQFTEGTIVRRGQTLYQIDPSLYRAAVNQAQANLQSAQANSESAVAKAQRYKPLAAMQAVAQQDYVDAAALAKQAVASVAQNRAALDTAKINLGYTTVPAPITGRIGRSLFTTGALVTSNQTEPLAQIQRLDPIYVDIQQSSADLLALRQELGKGGVVPSAATVRLALEDGTIFPLSGTLQFAEAVVDPATGAVTLRARFPNPQGLLLPGMYVRAKLSQATTNDGILVPQAAVTRDPQGQASVMLVGPDNKAVSRNVVTAQTVGGNWLVTSGLKPGDKVISEGLGKVKPGQPIHAVPAGSPPAAPSKDAEKRAEKADKHSARGG